MFVSTIEIDGRIERWDLSTGAESRLHEPRSSGSGSSSTACCAACSGPWGSGAEDSGAAPGRTLHNSRVDAAEEASSARAQDVGVREGKVVTGDGEIEIVL